MDLFTEKRPLYDLRLINLKEEISNRFSMHINVRVSLHGIKIPLYKK